MSCTTCGGGFTGCMCEGAPDSDFTRTDDFVCTMLDALGPVVDAARDVGVSLGTRPYAVYLVWTRWSGGRRGRGVEELAREVPVLPTPLMQSKSDLAAVLLGRGVDEQGFVRMSEVSIVRYTEDQLRGFGPGGAPIDDAENFYWEVRYPQALGGSILRRFTVRGVPERDMESLEWVIDLTRASEDRERGTGTPQG